MILLFIGKEDIAKKMLDIKITNLRHINNSIDLIVYG